MLNIHLLSSGNIYKDLKTILQIIFDKLKVFKIEIKKKMIYYIINFFNDFLNNIHILYLKQYILNINFNKVIENIGYINETNILNDNNCNLNNRILIDIF